LNNPNNEKSYNNRTPANHKSSTKMMTSKRTINALKSNSTQLDTTSTSLSTLKEHIECKKDMASAVDTNKENELNSTENNSLANSISKTLIKDCNKTPMCLINELIKYNKIKHEYVLLDEIGPAHKKTFYVTLKLGVGTENEESYTGIGSSIKKSQHAAAELALKQTKFKKPIREKGESNDSKENEKDKTVNDIKINSQNKKSKKALTATVKLNALAMKLGLVASYTYKLTSATSNLDLNVSNLLNPSTIQNQNRLKFESSNNYTNFMNNNIYRPFRYQNTSTQPNVIANMLTTQNSYYNSVGSIDLQSNRITRPKQLFLVKLLFGNKEFNSEGTTLQIGKHNAAEKALEYYSNPENFLVLKNLASSTQNKTLKAYRPPQFYKQQQLGNLKRFITSLC
jgi:hypothetical protein